MDKKTVQSFREQLMNEFYQLTTEEKKDFLSRKSHENDANKYEKELDIYETYKKCEHKIDEEHQKKNHELKIKYHEDNEVILNKYYDRKEEIINEHYLKENILNDLHKSIPQLYQKNQDEEKQVQQSLKILNDVSRNESFVLDTNKHMIKKNETEHRKRQRDISHKNSTNFSQACNCSNCGMFCISPYHNRERFLCYGCHLTSVKCVKCNRNAFKSHNFKGNYPMCKYCRTSTKI